MTQSNQIPACPSCKRRPQDGHDSWCPNHVPVWAPPSSSTPSAPAKPEPINVSSVVVPPAPMSPSPAKAEPKPAAASLTSSISRSAPQSDYGARPASPRPPERIDTLPSVNRPEAAPKPAAASIADAGIKPAMAPRQQPAARPAAASLADAGIKPMSPQEEPAVKPVMDRPEKAVVAPAKPVARPEPAPVAKAPKPEPAPKAEPKAKAKPEPAADASGEHRCDDCGKTEAETTFPRKGDWVSRVCRSCRKARGLRP